MHRFASLIVGLLVVLTLAPAAADAQNKSHPTMMVRCGVWSLEAELRLRSIPQVEILSETQPLHLDCLIFPGDLPLLRLLGLNPVIIHHDAEAFYASRLESPRDIPTGSMGGYLTFSEIVQQLDQWRSQYPNLITAKQSVGKSIEQRDQWMVKVSANADTDENEPEFFIHTLLHCREPAGMMSVMRCMEYLLVNYGKDPVVTDLLDNREIWYMPVANPDGYEYNRRSNPNGGGLWRKNRRGGYGVDLNRNFGYKWGFDNRGSSNRTSSSTYRGPSAFSEPETQTIRDFVNSRLSKGLTAAWDCHCYGALLMWPFGYANVRSPRDAAYKEISQDMVAANNFTAGDIYNTIYPANGSSVDWYEGGASLWSWTPEIGHRTPDGFWPPTSRILPVTEESLRMLLTGIKYAVSYLVVKSKAVTEVGNNNGAYDPGEKIQVTCVVRNKGIVTANAQAHLVSDSPFINIEAGSVNLGSIANVTDANNNAAPLRCAIHPSTPPGTHLGLRLVLAFNGHALSTPLDLICGKGNVLVNDACESRTWTTGVASDTAVRGKWTHGNPNPTYATSNNKFLVQTGDDHSSAGQNCYVTGNQSTTNGDSDDVDGGTTTLMTPVYDLSAARNPYVEFWRWFMDHGPNPNNDELRIDVTDDGGSSWKTVEKVDYSDPNWRRHAFWLRDHVRPTAQVRLRFVTSDAPDDSFCEALIDDLTITDYDDGVRITLSGSTKIGQAANIDLQATRSASLPYVAGAALGDTPGIPLTGRVLPLNNDPLFLSFWSLPQIFKNFTGTLDGSGKGQAQVAIPFVPPIIGATIYVAFVTLDASAPDGIRDLSPSLPITLTSP